MTALKLANPLAENQSVPRPAISPAKTVIIAVQRNLVRSWMASW